MKALAKRQLYTVVPELRLPDSVQHQAGGACIRSYQRVKTTAFVCWPDGRPCLPVNMYLLDNAHKWTGSTGVTYASELSELIRYCFKLGKGFAELTDADIYSLVDNLRNEAFVDDPFQRVRDDNTVIKIIQRCLIFLDWYQQKLYRGAFPVLGEREAAPAIVCERKKNQNNDSYYWTHRYLPTGNSTDPKLPMGLVVIEDINAAIDRLGSVGAYPEPVLRRFKRDPGFFESLLDYLYARRKFMVWIMNRTGLRPEEMARLTILENRNAHRDLVLIIPTMKRRKLEPPPRRFPINIKDGRMLLRYFSARETWIARCKALNANFVEPDGLFLSTEPGNFGGAIGKTGLTKDFERLCKLAGYADQQACFSMFRHRFITSEVLVHLRHWEQQKGRIISDQDYRSILERVREKTGHASVDSLWHYIDLAQEMGGVWNSIDEELDRLHACEDLKAELEDLRRTLRESKLKPMAAEQVIDLVNRRLSEILRKGESPHEKRAN